MARAKKPKYEYVESLNLFRKRVKDATGSYVAVYGKTPDELREKLELFQTYRNLSPVGKKNLFVNDYIQNWMDIHAKGMTYGGQVDYQSVINRHIKPPLEGIRMLDIHPDHIRAVLMSVSDKSESVYRKTYMLLNQVFSSAVENGDILCNPCPKPSKGGNPPREKVAVTDEQVKVLLDATKGTRAFVFCMIGVYTGMRREEILGLMWDCVHLNGTPRIEVKRALRFEHNQPVVSERLKTKAARRVIPIPMQLVECLKVQKATAKSDYVIANKAGTPLTQSQFRELWKAVVIRCTKERHYKKYVNGKQITGTVKVEKGQKIPHHNITCTIDFTVTPHILRHTYITNQLKKGTDIKTVQYLAGHATARITADIYAHLTYNKPEDMIDMVRAAFDTPAQGE